MFRSGECTFTTAKRTFTTAKRTFATAKYKTKACRDDITSAFLLFFHARSSKT